MMHKRLIRPHTALRTARVVFVTYLLHIQLQADVVSVARRTSLLSSSVRV